MIAFIALLSGEASPGKIKPARIFGRVVLNNYSRVEGIAPVIFDHWLHRAQFTCRLCHIDIGFAMNAGATQISAQTNMQGFYCGACHDGKRVHGGTTIFAACSDDPLQKDDSRCSRCHSRRKKGTRKYTFDTFAKGLPRHSMGDAIDWEKAEQKGQIKPVDFLDGISFERKALKAQDDFAIGSRADWMTDVIFSHKKHATWNGCEVCHPEIFPSTKKGTVKYNMFQVFNGQYCGVCHGKVAFSLFLCHKCHVNPVR
jgi:c(7)-type cytochrome triheme protein